jgi:hypothetical protein
VGCTAVQQRERRGTSDEALADGEEEEEEEGEEEANVHPHGTSIADSTCPTDIAGRLLALHFPSALAASLDTTGGSDHNDDDEDSKSDDDVFCTPEQSPVLGSMPAAVTGAAHAPNVAK